MILVTGATGRIGGAVVDRLHEEGHPVRALARRPAARGFPPRVQAVAADYERPDSLEPALEGVDTVFLLWPSGNDDPAEEVIQRITSKVGRIVYLSSIGVPDEPAEAQDPINASHALIEHTIRRSPVTWTFVRSGGLAANTLTWADDVRRESLVREPFGGIPRPLVHEKDLADVAVRALTEEGFEGGHCDINGPAVVTGAEQVGAIGRAVDREIRLEPLGREQAIARFGNESWASDSAEYIVDQWERMATGPAEQPTGEYTRLTGRPGRTFAQWAIDHRAEFL